MNFRRTVIPAGVLLIDFVTHTVRHPQENKTAERTHILKMLREELADTELEISYKPTGQPVVVSRPELFISIAHSNGWCALAISLEKAVGVDIQTFTSPLERGMDYFVNPEEQLQLREPVLPQLYLIWCAKEAFYKQQEGGITDLKNDVTVRVPSETAGAGTLFLEFEGRDLELLYRIDHEKAIVVTA